MVVGTYSAGLSMTTFTKRDSLPTEVSFNKLFHEAVFFKLGYDSTTLCMVKTTSFLLVCYIVFVGVIL